MAKKIIKAENTQKKEEKKIEKVQGVSDDSMAKLARIMSDAPSLVKLAGTEWEIRGLKPAVQWEIARLACEIKKVESATYGDILQDLAKNIPTVVRIITLALLNDKRRIEEEFDIVYDTLMWESNVNEFATLLFEILELQDVSFFFQAREVIEMFRQMTLAKKTKMTGGQK